MSDKRIESSGADVFDGTQFIVSRSLMKSTRAGQLLDGNEEILADIRVSPRIVWGCLTILVSVVLFFGLPALFIWLINQLLILMGTNFETVTDRNPMLGIPLVIAVISTGIAGAMSATWSLYRQKWRLLDDRKSPILSLLETGKYGAASLSISIHDAEGELVGRLHRNLWGEISLFDSIGQPCLHLRREGSLLRNAGREGMLAVVSGIVMFAVAMFLGGILVLAFKPARETYRIFRRRNTDGDAEEIQGTIIPLEPRARRVKLKQPLDPREKCLVLSAAVILTMYDF